MLRSDLRDFSDVYIVVTKIVSVSADKRDRDEMNRQVILRKKCTIYSLHSKNKCSIS